MANKKTEKWIADVKRTIFWLRAIVGMDHGVIKTGKPHDLDADAATAGDRMAAWFGGEGNEPNNVQRFRDAAAVLRKTPPEGWPKPAPAPETAPEPPQDESPTAPVPDPAIASADVAAPAKTEKPKPEKKTRTRKPKTPKTPETPAAKGGIVDSLLGRS